MVALEKGCEVLWVGTAEGEVQKASRAVSRVGNRERVQSSVSLARAGRGWWCSASAVGKEKLGEPSSLARDGL